MGQQQLLLIILGVIIVGIAVAVGINMFTASASAANRDAIISDLTNLAAMAQQHYRRPGAMGGGNNSFDGSRPTAGSGQPWIIPPMLRSTANGVYRATVLFDTVRIIGVGTEIGNLPAFVNDTLGPGSVQVTTTVSALAIRSAVNN